MEQRYQAVLEVDAGVPVVELARNRISRTGAILPAGRQA